MLKFTMKLLVLQSHDLPFLLCRFDLMTCAKVVDRFLLLVSGDLFFDFEVELVVIVSSGYVSLLLVCFGEIVMNPPLTRTCSYLPTDHERLMQQSYALCMMSALDLDSPYSPKTHELFELRLSSL